MPEAPQATVLCIDDTATEAQVRLLQSVLKKAGYKVLIARDAQEALATIRAHHVDMLLTEHIVPARGGASLAEQGEAAQALSACCGVFGHMGGSSRGFSRGRVHYQIGLNRRTSAHD